MQYYYDYVAALFGKDLDLEDSAYHTILFVQWCIDNQETIESKYNIKMTITERYNTDGSKNGLVSISISPNNAVTFGEIYKEFCEEQGFRVPYLLILDDPVKNSAALGKWLRLLMPQYGRRVEIEDLDRNFWVIAQVIAGLSNFLFDDDAPIPSLLKQMADEVVQLWENILYLWIEVAAASQKATPTVRVLDIPLPNDEERPWRKFDGFENSLEDRYYGFISTGSYFGIYNTQNGDTLRRCKSYADKYPNENLIIIAHQRLMNYRQNFYACEYYPEIFCYHCGTHTWKTYSIRMHLQKDLNKSWGTNIDPKTYYINGCPITLHKLADTKVDDSFFVGNLHDHPSSIWAASGLNRLESLIGAFSIEDYGYTTFSPCDNPPDPEEDSNLYYGAVRCIPHVEYDLTIDDIKITNFYIDIYDASAMIRNEDLNAYQIARVGLEDNAGFGTQMGIDEENQIIYCKMNYLVEEAPVLELEDHNCIAQPVTHQALYMGEVASYYAEEGEKPIFNGLYFGKIIAAPADDETARRANIADGTLTSGGKALVNLLSSESAYDVDKSLVIATAGSNSIEGYNVYGPYELGYRYYTSTGLVYGSNLQRYDVYHASTDGGLVVTF
ncbi:MAG: hypothetical protein LUC37_01825 [Prevotella sp.]|nr:hypothetical protein [Prevotella sp.]